MARGAPPRSKRAPDATDMEDVPEDIVGDDGEGMYNYDHEDLFNAKTDPYANETADEKRLRLAQAHLNRLGASGDLPTEFKDEADVLHQFREGDREILAGRLDQNLMQAQGKATSAFAWKLSAPGEPTAVLDPSTFMSLRGHSRSVTCVAVGRNVSGPPVVCSGSKDASVIRYDVETGKRLAVYRPGKFSKKKQRTIGVGHTKGVVAVDVSADGRMIASGSEDGTCCIWDARSNNLIRTLRGHKSGVTAVAFRKPLPSMRGHDLNQLYTGSRDRTVRVWNVDEWAFIETLFGHQEPVTNMCALGRERAFSVSEDGTARLWKILTQSQVVLNGTTKKGLDACAMPSDEHFLTGGMGGEITLWSAGRKKPLHVLKGRHGQGPEAWVSALGAVPYGDLGASGGHSGVVKLYDLGLTLQKPRLSLVAEAHIPGFVNGIAFEEEARFMAVATGKDHRLGAWGSTVLPASTRNEVVIVPLPTGSEEDGNGDDFGSDEDYSEDQDLSA